MNDPDLETLIAAEPSDEAWQAIKRVLYSLSEDELEQLPMERYQAALAHWPIETRNSVRSQRGEQTQFIVHLPSS